MGRWRRHIYQGVADTIERQNGLEHGTMLETPWRKLDPKLKDLLLHGTGEQHITFTWRQRRSTDRNTAAIMKASCRNCWNSIAPATARCRFASWKST